MPKPTLSDAARSGLQAAYEHPKRFALPPPRIPIAAQRAVVRSLLNAGLIEEVEASGGQPSWRVTDAGQRAVSTGWAAPGVGVECPMNVFPLAGRQPRPDTKRALVLCLVRRAEDTTVQGLFADLRKAGAPVEVTERVRQVGPGKQGTAGSYTVYSAAEAG